MLLPHLATAKSAKIFPGKKGPTLISCAQFFSP